MKNSIIAALLLVASLTFGCSGQQMLTQEQLANCPPLPNDYQAMIKDHVSRDLIDPTSPLYYFGTPRRIAHKGECTWMIPVEINAKNRFGGYVGRQRGDYVLYHGKTEEVNQFASGFANGAR